MFGLCWLWLLLHDVAGFCQFPSYLQTNITRGDATPAARQEYQQQRRLVSE